MSTTPDPHARVAARRAQIHSLRTRVATLGVVAFLALWSVLFVQLASGHDPGLNDASPAAVVQSADPAAVDTSSDGWPDDSALPNSDATSDGAASDAGAAGAGGAVTTRQS
jgi:hypothetical protein